MIGRISMAAGACVLAPDYRLAPEDPFPAAPDDALATYRWLIHGGVDPRQVIVAGDTPARHERLKCDDGDGGKGDQRDIPT